jgi:Na+/H+-dicarboxylate symporter
VVGTSSSETVIPDMIRKLEGLGSPRATVGLVFRVATIAVNRWQGELDRESLRKILAGG